MENDLGGKSEEDFVNSMIDNISQYIAEENKPIKEDQLIIAIDPGFHNFGMVCGYFQRKAKRKEMEIHWRKVSSVCLNVCEPKDDIPSMYQKVTAAILNKGIHKLPGISTSLIIVEAAPYIPKNMKLVKELTQLTSIIYCVLNEMCKGAIVQMVQPATMKRNLKIATKNYADNKTAAEEFCYRKLCIAPSSNHEADCWCYIYHCFWDLYEKNPWPKYMPKRTVVFKFDESVMISDPNVV